MLRGPAPTARRTPGDRWLAAPDKAPSAAAMAEGPAAPQQDDVAALMLQEAQAEMGKLRAELYSVRRLAEERRWACCMLTMC